MTTPKWTPGPWHTNAIRNGRVIGDAGTEGLTTADKIQICNANATVATVYRPKDARLMAAAPDLAEALAMCLERFESAACQVWFGERDDEAIDAARVALAKANGS